MLVEREQAADLLAALLFSFVCVDVWCVVSAQRRRDI